MQNFKPFDHDSFDSLNLLLHLTYRDNNKIINIKFPKGKSLVVSAN